LIWGLPTNRIALFNNAWRAAANIKGGRVMEAANEPLHENDVGAFGDLAQRPNPDDLVILPLPPLEDLLPSLRQQLGRDLTPEEIERHRLKAPSIVVSRLAAEKMQAERANRPPPVRSEPVLRPPTLTSDYRNLPTEVTARKEAAVDLFGQHIFSLRNQLAERVRRTVESEDSRKRLGSLHSKEYDAVAALAPAERDAALSLARKAIDLYMQDILGLFTGRGDSLHFGGAHAINYRLVLEVKEVESDEVVEDFEINRGCQKAFFTYYGRWLNRYGNHV